MFDLADRTALCNVCKREYTAIHAEAMPGVELYVCEHCLEAAKHNFIWICMGCGKVYMRPKTQVIKNLDDLELKHAYEVCKDMQLIQGIDMCIACDPDGVVEYVTAARLEKKAGIC